MLTAKPSWMEFVVASNGYIRPKGGTYHQHWVSTYHALDAAEKVVWVPAHISEARIGEVLCGNGTPITRDVWLGNKLVDELAKLGAQAIKAPQEWCGGWLPGSGRLRNSLSLLGR